MQPSIRIRRGEFRHWSGAPREACLPWRPRKAAAEKQAYPVQVNLTRDERHALDELAGEQPLASYLLRLVRRHLARRRR